MQSEARVLWVREPAQVGCYTDRTQVVSSPTLGHLERVRSLMLGEGCLVRCWAEALQPQRWRTFWQRLRVTASGPLPAWAGAENISF